MVSFPSHFFAVKSRSDKLKPPSEKLDLFFSSSSPYFQVFILIFFHFPSCFLVSSSSSSLYPLFFLRILVFSSFSKFVSSLLHSKVSLVFFLKIVVVTSSFECQSCLLSQNLCLLFFIRILFFSSFSESQSSLRPRSLRILLVTYIFASVIFLFFLSLFSLSSPSFPLSSS